MAVRWVMESYEDEPPSFDRRPQIGNGCEGVLDNFLMQRRKTLDYDSMGSALGHRKAVNNENVRAVSIDTAMICMFDSIYIDLTCFKPYYYILVQTDFW